MLAGNVLPELLGVVLQANGGGLLELLFSPFRELAQILLDTLVSVLADSPTISPNPPIREVHRLTLIVTYAASGLVVIAAGFYYITGIYLGVSYRVVRLILPRLVIAVAFATVSLPLLQLGVEVADAFVEAFRPHDTVMVEQLAGLSTSLVLVWFINAWLLLALVLLFIFRNIYLLFVAAISPLLALAWSLPNTRPYADSFISAWFTLLAVAPLDVLVLRFNLALLQGSGAMGLQPVSNWILGIASFVLMLWIPRQLYGVSQSMVGSSKGIAGSAGRSITGRVNDRGRDPKQFQDKRRRRRERRRNRDRNRRGRW